MSAVMAAVNVGLIGCGRVTEHHHLPALARVGGVQVCALADVDERCLARVADRFGVRRRYTDYRRLLDDGDIDVVAVCVPAWLHAEVACAALESGCHVFVEKPLALTLADADRILGAEAASGTTVAVGFNLRAHRLVERARAVIASGQLGRIELVRGAWTAGLRHRMVLPEWRRRRSTGGGVLFEVGVHHFDLWRHLLGVDVTAVSAACLTGPGEDEIAAVTATLGEGILASAAFSQGTSDSNELEFFGDRGRMRLSLYRVDGLELFPLGAGEGGIAGRVRRAARQAAGLPEAVRLARRGGVYLESFTHQWQQFIGKLEGDAGAVELASVADGRQALAVVLAAVEAADGGRRFVEVSSE